MTIKSEIGIINFALAQLSIDPIPSTNEDSKIARAMKSMFQLAKESILRSYVYDWSHKVTKLVVHTDALKGFLKPSDYINIIGLGNREMFGCCIDNYENLASYTHSVSVREVNGRLYIQSCCMQHYQYLHYTFDNLNYTSMPMDLLETIGYKLAYLACMQLTNDTKLTVFLMQRVDDAGSKAQRHAGFENKPLDHQTMYRYPLAPKNIGFY